MVKAGYNPVAYITVGNKIFNQERYDIFSSHPLGSKRLAKVYEYIYNIRSILFKMSTKIIFTIKTFFLFQKKTERNRKISHISKRGTDRVLWVYPSFYIFNCFFGAGLLLIPIRGGHVKLKPGKVYELETF